MNYKFIKYWIEVIDLDHRLYNLDFRFQVSVPKALGIRFQIEKTNSL